MADLSRLTEATAAVQHSPHAVSAWEDAEALAAELDAPDEIIKLYNEALAGKLDANVAEMIGERAGQFCDEWFGDDPKVLEAILSRVLAVAPASEAALQRLSVLYTVAERWDDILGLYDRAIDVNKERSRRIRLLREAAQLAKDVANQPEKAIAYFQQLLPLVPDDAQMSTGLERLLERHDRWADLIALWESRLDGQSKRDRERSRARIAGVLLDSLADPAGALGAVKPLLLEADDDKESIALLERIIESVHATSGVRASALDLLRSHFDETSRPREVIRVLEKIIAISPQNTRDLREEAGSRLAELGDLPAAMDHYAALLAVEPTSTVVEEKLRQLAEQSGGHDRYATGLAEAARACPEPTRKVELLAEAARTRVERLADVERAIELYAEASAVTGAAEHEQLQVARRLAALYTQTGQQRERLAVLERQAQLEANDSARAAILSEAARLAETLGDSDRALSLWERRADTDPSDVSALDARIGILEAQQRWDDLVEALEGRAAKASTRYQKRADLVRVAQVHHQQRDDRDAAIATWQRVVAEDRDDEEAVAALSDLLADAGRWREMADLLEDASGRATVRTVGRLVRLGSALPSLTRRPTVRTVARPEASSSRSAISRQRPASASRSERAATASSSSRSSATTRCHVAIAASRSSRCWWWTCATRTRSARFW